MANNSWQDNVAVFAYDIVGFASFDQAGQRDAKALTDRVLEAATKDARLGADQTYYQDAGDGGYLMITTDARKALDVLEAFFTGMAQENQMLQEEYRVKNRYALHYDTIIVEGAAGDRRFLGDAINNCARLLTGMSRDYLEQAVCSGAYRRHVLTFGKVDEQLFTRLLDIVDGHGNHHEVWNLHKSPGFGIPVPKRGSLGPAGGSSPDTAAAYEPVLKTFPLEDAFEDGEPDLLRVLRWDYGLAETLYGRDDELRAILNWAEGGPNTATVRLITGEGGAGKTRLAAAAAL